MVREITFDAPDGLKLYARVYEPAREVKSLPLVCLPGLTRNARDFHELALVACGTSGNAAAVISFDYRGRGLSAYDPDFTHYNIGTEAGDVIAGLGVLGIDRAVFLGTSRGGLIIHILAAIAPQLLAGVILNDIGPEIAPAGLMQISQYLSNPRMPKSWTEAAEIAARRAWRRISGAEGCGLGALRPCDLPRDRWRYPPRLRPEPVEDAARH